ncbi:MAG: L,D-transpeptidase [Pseudobdellovibrionaceae bacterium]
MKKLTILIIISVFSLLGSGFDSTKQVPILDSHRPPLIGEPSDFDQTDPNYERYYDSKTGLPIDLGEDIFGPEARCRQNACPVWAYVSISAQRLYLYVNGSHVATWKVSTGLYARTKTGNFNPTRVYDRYDSSRYPEGDYKGMGNMPYAVFYYRGYAIHGTPEGNWKKLGRRASHGCIRLHPDNAYRFNRLVRSYGLRRSWVTVR